MSDIAEVPVFSLCFSSLSRRLKVCLLLKLHWKILKAKVLAETEQSLSQKSKACKTV